MIKAWDFKCPVCESEWEEFTNNPKSVTHCGTRAVKIWKSSTPVHQDSIEGGQWIENLGPEPVKVYSKTELQREMKARGLEQFVRHTPVPGTDKAPHTSNWASVSKETLEGAKGLLERHAGRNSNDDSVKGVIKWEKRELPGVN